MRVANLALIATLAACNQGVPTSENGASAHAQDGIGPIPEGFGPIPGSIEPASEVVSQAQPIVKSADDEKVRTTVDEVLANFRDNQVAGSKKFGDRPIEIRGKALRVR